MSSKRKMPPMGLQRRVRPRREDKWEAEPEIEDQSSEDEDDVSEEGIGGQDSEDDSGSEDSEENSESEADAPAPKTDLSTISFGALARAQASLPSSKRSKKPAQPPSDDSDPHSPPERDDSKRPATKASMKRSSKHAPQEQTSKKPVSRRREVVSTETKRAPARDPRFDVTMGKMTPQEEARAKKAYAFLEKYRDDELAELKAQVKKTKDPDQKEELKRQVMVIESRRKTNKRKEERESIMREHRAKEKELVAQGKQPFYLKRAEQKKQALTKRFEGLSKGQRDKAIERKRKKVAGKEKKELDFLERRQH